MRNGFFRWLTGAAPQLLGVYWGVRGACLVLNKPDGGRYCVFQPPTVDGPNSTLSLALQRMEVLTGFSRRDIGLAVAVDADDVFFRSLQVSAGMSERQVAQVAIVEAVASLPVPPEEICLDFIRTDLVDGGAAEMISVAFCRREVIDEILAESEGIGANILVVDRDAQALHDATLAYLDPEQSSRDAVYPFAMLLTESNPRVLICLNALTLETYPLRLPASPGADHSDLTQQIANCWTRCRMAHGANLPPLRCIVELGSSDPGHGINPGQLGLEIPPKVVVLPSGLQQAWDAVVDVAPPDEVMLIASGMAGRGLKRQRFNLMPHRQMAEALSRRVLGRQVGIAGLAGMICASAGAMVLERQLADSTLAGQKLGDAVAELAPLSRESKQMEQRFAGMLQRQRLIEALDARRSTSVLLLADVAESMSSRLYLVRFEENGERFVVEGRAVNAITAGHFFNRLAGSEFLYGLELEEIRLVDQDAPAPYQFRISALVKLKGASRENNAEHGVMP